MRSQILKHCAGKGYNAPFHQENQSRVKSDSSLKTSNNTGDKYSSEYKSNVSIDDSDGSKAQQFTKQTEKPNGKSKFKQYNAFTNQKDGNNKLVISVKTNTGRDSERVITNPNRIERKMKRVLGRNQDK
jgi:hypothetical protein